MRIPQVPKHLSNIMKLYSLILEFKFHQENHIKEHLKSSQPYTYYMFAKFSFTYAHVMQKSKDSMTKQHHRFPPYSYFQK